MCPPNLPRHQMVIPRRTGAQWEARGLGGDVLPSSIHGPPQCRIQSQCALQWYVPWHGARVSSVVRVIIFRTRAMSHEVPSMVLIEHALWMMRAYAEQHGRR